jgi:hypothetical protein
MGITQVPLQVCSISSSRIRFQPVNFQRPMLTRNKLRSAV